MEKNPKFTVTNYFVTSIIRRKVIFFYHISNFSVTQYIHSFILCDVLFLSFLITFYLEILSLCKNMLKCHNSP